MVNVRTSSVQKRPQVGYARLTSTFGVCRNSAKAEMQEQYSYGQKALFGIQTFMRDVNGIKKKKKKKS